VWRFERRGEDRHDVLTVIRYPATAKLQHRHQQSENDRYRSVSNSLGINIGSDSTSELIGAETLHNFFAKLKERWNGLHPIGDIWLKP